MSFLRDPVWGFIAVAVAVIIFVIGWWQRTRKQLSYEVLSHGPIVTVSRAAKNVVTESIEIRYNGMPVRDVQLVEVRLWNSGSVAIVESDYRESITISFGGKMLAFDAIESVPSALKQGVIAEGASTPDHSHLGLHRVLLNQKDSVTVQALLTNFNGKVSVDARIVGIPSIRRAGRQPLTRYDVARELLMFLFGVAGVLLGFALASSVLSNILIGVGGLLMGTVAGYFVTRLSISKRLIRRR